ncbi:hypothetical protein E0H88_03980 [Acinetobacter sp. ANC 4216]|uniref:hypothetical protein n=1 Tax=Acinetobacter sp. ANC 4216 TaxID=2529840 RepID=UPI00103FE618|nr:hypothetical protein [Acinetobacter sp. ANC 4216]TCB71590.1 hypothetical protein E0H88_03980 [Acinetobacter sp. ANC 4216]
MTYFIGGNFGGQAVDKNHLDLKDQVISKRYGPLTGMERLQESYIRTSVSIKGNVKTFYIIRGSEPADHRDQILKFWDEVETDVYAI